MAASTLGPTPTSVTPAPNSNVGAPRPSAPSVLAQQAAPVSSPYGAGAYAPSPPAAPGDWGGPDRLAPLPVYNVGAAGTGGMNPAALAGPPAAQPFNGDLFRSLSGIGFGLGGALASEYAKANSPQTYNALMYYNQQAQPSYLAQDDYRTQAQEASTQKVANNASDAEMAQASYNNAMGKNNAVLAGTASRMATAQGQIARYQALLGLVPQELAAQLAQSGFQRQGIKSEMGGAESASAEQQRQLLSKVTAQGGMFTPGFPAGRTAISNALTAQLGSYGAQLHESLAGDTLQRLQAQKETANYNERIGQYRDVLDGLKETAAQYGAEPAYFLAQLHNGLSKLGLDSEMSVVDLNNKLHSSNHQDQLTAKQVIDSAIGNASYFSPTLPSLPGAPPPINPRGGVGDTPYGPVQRKA